ncbi:hypothetical protein SLEP1_g30724 [Rubroshorea leprosula]|uniref:Uncharacterized protein n=1 Tax=Rubroshorea leprosula TaxID=152421 RepID=A0AAV5K6Y1_9ROSI|nr:hypothetical protein SLEP1_g30724 [Rubroshorea leprosula]
MRSSVMERKSIMVPIKEAKVENNVDAILDMFDRENLVAISELIFEKLVVKKLGFSLRIEVKNKVHLLFFFSSDCC